MFEYYKSNPEFDWREWMRRFSYHDNQEYHKRWMGDLIRFWPSCEKDGTKSELCLH